MIKLILINLITLTRLTGSFFVPFVFNNYGYKIVSIFCLCLFLTDCIDGFLARKLNSCTFFGSLTDAFSDKFLAIISLSIIFTISPTILILIILEVLIALVNMTSYFFSGNAQTSKIGKIKTLFMGITIVGSLLLLMNFNINNNINLFINIMSILTIILSFITLINYTLRMIKSIKNRDKIKKESLKIKSFKKIISDLFDTSYFNEYKNKSYKYLLYSIK